MEEVLATRLGLLVFRMTPVPNWAVEASHIRKRKYLADLASLRLEEITDLCQKAYDRYLEIAEGA